MDDELSETFRRAPREAETRPAGAARVLAPASPTPSARAASARPEPGGRGLEEGSEVPEAPWQRGYRECSEGEGLGEQAGIHCSFLPAWRLAAFPGLDLR